jgi:long-chain acyl-CoA synthetase
MGFFTFTRSSDCRITQLTNSMGSSEIKTLNELFLTAVAKHAKPDCFLFKSEGQYQGVSSQEALRKAAALASLLTRLGVQRGDRVAILSENRVEWALTDYALLGLGAIPVPIYTTLLEPDIEYILRDSEAKGIVVATEPQLAKVVNVRPHLPNLKFVLAMDCARLQGTGAECWEGSIALELGLMTNAVELFTAKAQAAKPEDVATILYTSGTMGKPKGVILTHSNIVSNVLECRKLFTLSRDDAGISLLPLSHILERTLDFLCFWAGVSIAYAENLDSLPLNLREVRPTLMGVVPRVLEKIHARVMDAVRSAPPARQKIFRWALGVGKQAFPHRLKGRSLPLFLRLKHGIADRLIFSKVREQLGGRITILVSGAAPLARELAEFFCAMGLPVYEGYGLTETSPVIALNCPGHTKLGTVGPLIAGVEVKFGEENPDPEGGAGREILVKGPNVSQGYYHMEEETRAAFVDGWFHTGDLGAMDEEGYLRITGRKKNLFKTSGGKYVSPEKLENLFQSHPYVHQIVVLGAGRKFVGALVAPVFQRLEDHARTHGVTFQTREELVAHPEIRAFMQQLVDETTRWLPPHERIRQIVLLSRELTMGDGEVSPTLKVKRRVVEEKYREVIEEMFSRHAPKVQESGARSQESE